MGLLTVQNRTENPFVGMWDGIEYVVADRLTVPDYIAHHLKGQSIARDNPLFPESNMYRLGIVELGDDVNPLESIPLESLDRSDFDELRKVRIVQSGIRTARAPREGTGASGVTTSKER